MRKYYVYRCDNCSHEVIISEGENAPKRCDITDPEECTGGNMVLTETVKENPLTGIAESLCNALRKR